MFLFNQLLTLSYFSFFNLDDFLYEEFNLVIGKLKGKIWMTEKRQEVCVRICLPIEILSFSSIFTFVTDILYLGGSSLLLKH